MQKGINHSKILKLNKKGNQIRINPLKILKYNYLSTKKCIKHLKTRYKSKRLENNLKMLKSVKK